MTTILAFLLSSFIFLLSKIVEEGKELSQEKQKEAPKRVCPTCGSYHLIKNGSIHNGKPKHQCKNCGRQFVANPIKTIILSETKQLIDKLLLERISLRGIARVTQVSWSWLQNYVNQKLACIPRKISLSSKLRGKLIIECDEMWSFVDSKKNELYIWLAIDRNTKEIERGSAPNLVRHAQVSLVGCFVGDRTRK